MFSLWKGSEFGPEVKNHVYLLMIFIFIFMISLTIFVSLLFVCFHPLEKKMATRSSTLAWKIPWTEERGRLPSA